MHDFIIDNMTEFKIVLISEQFATITKCSQFYSLFPLEIKIKYLSNQREITRFGIKKVCATFITCW